MKKVKIIAFSIAIIVLSAFTFLIGNWNIDPNYSIKFSGNKVEGTFSGLSGTIQFDKNDLAHSKIDVIVNTNTIKTGNALKDKHAKGKSWFDVKKYPTIKFTSSSFAESEGTLLVTGTLEMHGVKKEIAIPFTFTEAESKGVFTGSFKVNRKDFGINGNMMGSSVGNEFDVTLNVPVSK